MTIPIVSETKARYHTLYTFECEEMGPIVFAPMSIKDVEQYLYISKVSYPIAAELEAEFLCKYIIEPIFTIDKIKPLPYGETKTVFNIMLYLSHPSGVNDIINNIQIYRSVFKNNLLDQMFSFICQAFPAYTPDTLKEKKWPELITLITMAEFINGDFEIVTSETAKQKKRKPISEERIVTEDPREEYLKQHGQQTETSC